MATKILDSIRSINISKLNLNKDISSVDGTMINQKVDETVIAKDFESTVGFKPNNPGSMLSAYEDDGEMITRINKNATFKNSFANKVDGDILKLGLLNAGSPLRSMKRQVF